MIWQETFKQLLTFKAAWLPFGRNGDVAVAEMESRSISAAAKDNLATSKDKWRPRHENTRHPSLCSRKDVFSAAEKIDLDCDCHRCHQMETRLKVASNE